MRLFNENTETALLLQRIGAFVSLIQIWENINRCNDERLKDVFSGLHTYISSRTMNEQSRVVAIEGNTGCGKTEVLHWLSKFPDVITCEVSALSIVLKL